MLDPGVSAPPFTAPNQKGTDVSLAEFSGHWLLLWWYPAAGMPGCSRQATGLSELAAEFNRLDCAIVGISFDTVKDNAAFHQSHDLPFPLLSDVRQKIGSDYNVTRKKTDVFSPYAQRRSYLIDPDRRIVANYDVSDPGGHAATVLTDLKAIQR